MAAFIVLLFCSAIIAFLYYKYENTVSSLKQQCMLLTRQNKSLKTKLSESSKKYKNIILKYSNISISNGVLNTESSLYIAPIDDSIIINSLAQDTKIKLLRICEHNTNIWYEVLIETQDNINSLGWIKEDNITLIDLSEEMSSDDMEEEI